LYGNDSFFYKKIKDDKKIKFYNTSINDKLEYLFANIIGKSENYNIS